MVKRIPIGDGKSYRVQFKSRPVKVAEADETDGYLDGTVKLISDAVLQKFFVMKKEWRDIAFEKNVRNDGHRVDLRVRCQDLSFNKKVYWHRLLFFVSSGDYPVTKAGWAEFDKTVPEQEVDHVEKKWRRIVSDELELVTLSENRKRKKRLSV